MRRTVWLLLALLLLLVAIATCVAKPDQGGLVRIELAGAISAGGGGANSASGLDIAQTLRKAGKEGVKGVLLAINSPGGSAAASQMIYDEIQNLRKQNVKVVASMGDVAASGGYYAAAGCDEIVALPATLTGSIGVIMQSFNAQGLMSKLGLDPIVLKSGRYKDIGSPFKPMSADERKMLQELLDSTYEQFLKDVAKGRKIPLSKLRDMAGGRIYTGEQAHKIGLVDRLGAESVAADRLRELTGMKDAPLRRYGDKPFGGLFKLLGAQASIEFPPRIPLMLYGAGL